MALSDVQYVRILYGDVPRNPFYGTSGILSDEEVEELLFRNSGDVYEAAKIAAMSAAFILSTFNTKEMFGDVEAWNEAARQYRGVLESFIKESKYRVPSGLVPWCAGISVSELVSSLTDCDNAKQVDVEMLLSSCYCAGE